MTKVATAAKAAKTVTTTDNSFSPIWKEQIGRVQGAMWRHVDDEGKKVRYTVSISRSYMDKKTKTWESVHYFDSKELRDVHLLCDAAEEEVLRQKNMTQAVEED